ncbi:MAG: GNAT family N-acetyltransferase [Beijerinckiaceae bacterium]|nr:GNAT family N-acetyltransferase [Beijerinckiaceae bacterium]
MISDPFTPFASSYFRIKHASDPWEVDGAARLRREVFCREQGIFENHDRDEIDAVALHIVALSSMAVLSDEVVGTVRIHQPQPGVWTGSRLAVDRGYRRTGALGAALIKLAVSTATSVGCQRFYAHVQSQNELMFRRLNWQRIEEIELHGLPHVLMQADLAAYPPLINAQDGFHALAKRIAA